MIRLHAKHYPTLTFSPDDPVLAMYLDREARIFVVGVTGAYVDPDLMLEGVRLELSAWAALRIQEHLEGGVLATIEHLPAELADICEFEIRDGMIRVSGFLRQAFGWFELTFQNSNMVVEYAGQRNVRSREHTP